MFYRKKQETFKGIGFLMFFIALVSVAGTFRFVWNVIINTEAFGYIFGIGAMIAFWYYTRETSLDVFYSQNRSLKQMQESIIELDEKKFKRHYKKSSFKGAYDEDFMTNVIGTILNLKERGIRKMRIEESICGSCFKGEKVYNYLTDDDPFYNFAYVVVKNDGIVKEFKICKTPVMLADLNTHQEKE